MKSINENQLYITINIGGCKNYKQFMKTVSEELDFPSYYGNNRDAFDECMRDLSWIEETEIIIEFKNLKRLKIKNNNLYNEITDAIDFYTKHWKYNKVKYLLD